MATLFFIDLDGTLVDAAARMEIAGGEPDRFSDKKAHESWLQTIQSEALLSIDKPVKGMIQLVKGVHNQTFGAVFLTAREERYRTVTEAWLKEQGLSHIRLVMRPNGNEQPYHNFKEEAIKEELETYPGATVVVLDDDPSGMLANVCRRNSWTMLKAVVGGVP